MNRRSFFHRAFSAIVAARMARELSASPIEREEEPEPPAMEEWRGATLDCPDCTYKVERLFGFTGEIIGMAKFRDEFCERCRLERFGE